MTFPLSIFALNKEVFVGEAKSVSVPGIEGRLQILPNHIPLVTPLREGDIVIEGEDRRENLPITGGVLEVNEKEVVILVNF